MCSSHDSNDPLDILALAAAITLFLCPLRVLGSVIPNAAHNGPYRVWKRGTILDDDSSRCLSESNLSIGRFEKHLEGEQGCSRSVRDCTGEICSSCNCE